MMATAAPPSGSSFLPLLESLEDSAAGPSEQTDAYLTIANRLSGEEGRQFIPAVEQNFSRLGKVTLAHITSPHVELSQAALQSLGFCVYYSRVVSGIPESFASEILSSLCSLVVNSADKNTCTRALWVISKQSFPQDVVAKKVSTVLDTLENVWRREDIQSVVMEHEALNVVIRMLEQVPARMGDAAVRWAKLIIPLVVHSASKVRLRAAAAMELGMPLLLEKQADVAAIIEPMMSTKLIPELQKLFVSKNETNVLKLWPLFVKLLGKLLHKGGPFINSLLHLEELGFRSSSPTIKKIAFIAWKSLIDNFALNPDILCSGKRIKLLMQPLTSIHVRTEALLLTKVEVWWYLAVKLGPNLSCNFDQVAVPLLQSAIGSDSSSVSGTPSRAVSQNGTMAPGTPGFSSPASTSRVSLNSSVQVPTSFPSIQLLGLEMLLHYFQGPEVVTMVAKNKLILSLEPLNHALLSSASSFTKHAAVLTASVRDGFINIGRHAPESLLAAIWTRLVHFVNSTIESVGSKKDRHGCEVLTLMLQALQSIVASEALPADKILILFEATVKGISPRVLGSASYQVGKLDVLNGTPALFLILLLLNDGMLVAYVEDKRFLPCLQTLVGCGLSGPTSPLAFGEAVLGAISRNAESLQNKEQLWMVWSAVVSPLTDTITQTNEVNQGDALEHNFSAIHAALLLPVTHLLHGTPLQQATQKSMLCTWSKLYKVFARCSALVITAEENICCEELCVKMTPAVDRMDLKVPSTLNSVTSILQVMLECFDFSPYTAHFQQRLKSPHTPVNWAKKRNKVLGNLSTFLSLVVKCLAVYLEGGDAAAEATGLALVAILNVVLTNPALANTVKAALTLLVQPVSRLFKHAASEALMFSQQLLGKLEKLAAEVLGCLQSCSALAFDSELLDLLSPLLCALFPHKNKQLRTSVTQFWNSTFANSVSLTYPDEIRPVLSLVKQKTPIILPGFESVSVSDELSAQYSSESSQLETRIIGIPLSTGKKDSLFGNAAEPKDNSASKTSSKNVSAKLDFGSPKPSRREILEEEASIDFVFIPPETKERVLTEHQKEVKRTKRVDIPAMYNNLDASLDTTVFTQYTQSQEETDKMETEPSEAAVGADDEVPQDVENEEDPTSVLTKDTQDYFSPNAQEHQNVVVPESDGEDYAKSDDESKDLESQSKESTSPNTSSDLFCGTPQKTNSRRQPFITLEKYSGGKSPCPDIATTFSGPLIKATDSQERCNTSGAVSSLASQTSTGPGSQDSSATPKKRNTNQSFRNDASESPVRPRECGTTCEPTRLIERLSSKAKDDDDDVEPDTQIETQEKENEEMASTLEDESLSQEEKLDDSQSSVTNTSSGEPRRSGRHRVRTSRPGEDPKEPEEKPVHPKRTRSQEALKGGSQKLSLAQSKPNTRKRPTSEEDNGKERLRTRAQTGQTESSQTNSQGRTPKRVKLYSSSQDFLDAVEPKRRSTRESSQSDLQPEMHVDGKSQSQGRSGRKSKTSLPTKEENETETKVSQDGKESTQTESLQLAENLQKEDEPKGASQKMTPQLEKSDSTEERKVGELSKKDEDAKEDSQNTTTKPGTQSQELVSSGTIEAKIDSATIPVSPTDIPNTMESSDEILSQEDSKGNELLSQDGQSLRRSRRSKVSSETEESEEKRKNNKSTRPSRSCSQVSSPANSQTKTTAEGRGRRSTQLQLQTKSSPLSTPENSQSANVAGSAESSNETGRYSGRRSSQASQSKINSSVVESSEPRANLPVPKKRGRKPKVGKQNPLSPESNLSMQDIDQSSLNNSESMQDCQTPESNLDDSQSKQDNPLPESSTEDPQSTQNNPVPESNLDDLKSVEGDPVPESNLDELKSVEGNPVLESNLDDLQTKQDFQGSESLEETRATMTDDGESQTEMDCESPSVSRHMDKQTPNDSNSGIAFSQDHDATDLQTPERHQTDAGQEEVSCEVSLSSDKGKLSPGVEMMPDTEKLVEETKESSSPCDAVEQKPVHHPEDQELKATDLAEVAPCPAYEGNLMDCSSVMNSDSKEEEQLACVTDGMSPSQNADATDVASRVNQDVGTEAAECRDDEDETKTDDAKKDCDVASLEVCTASALASGTVGEDVFLDSPLKQKDIDGLMGQDLGQSPSSRTRGTWSPSASPSTSILKKGQKRPLEDQTPSPLVKSRRVSFADPIQQQETADDIDRRSPAVRTSSPRRTKNCSIPLPKYITTPTKGHVFMSPKSLHSPGHRSSKKCLISEMSQEPRPVSKDCIYPALVGCSAPVEVVLPQISSNMWSRGFGQLIRARNVKTVGDLSALTPSEIKTLPIRSPKVSNVKKALRVYEQQRKGRGGDELKSFAETEMMTSEPEETCPRNQDEEKTSGETLAEQLVDEPARLAEGEPEKEEAATQPAGRDAAGGLLTELEGLGCRMTPSELGRCSAQQLVQLHHKLGDMMRQVVTQLHSRVCQSDPEP